MVEQSNDTVQSSILAKKLRSDFPDVALARADDDGDVFGQVTVVAPTHVSDDATSVVCPTELPHMKVAAQNDDDNSADKPVGRNMKYDDDDSAPDEDDDKTLPTSRDDERTVFNENTVWFDENYRVS
eukprot:s1946_g4.t1